MNGGVTFFEVNYDTQWIENSIARVQGFAWLYEWGMFLFLLLAVAILFWIFYDSITKKKDKQALVPRILAMVGLFAIMPAFIFRFTGSADGVTTLVRLGAEAGTPYYPGPINWNVHWLVAGYGPTIAIVALAGMLVSAVALVIYASSVQRSKPSTEFVQAFDSKMSNLESKVEEVRRSATSSATKRGGSVADKSSVKTIIDRKPQAATIIDLPSSGATLTVQTSGGRGRGMNYNLPASDVMIGRSTSCYIVIDDGKVSGEHVKLIYNGGTWLVLDNGSTNGTKLNGNVISGQQPLMNGDQIQIGDTVMVFGNAQ